MDRVLKILHVITRLILGGAQQNTVLSATEQVRAGHDVAIAFGPIYGPEGSLLEDARASGAALHEMSHLRRAVNPCHDALAYRQLRRLIAQLKPDLVHTHSSKAGIVARFAAWHERVPAVLHTVHGLPFHDHQSRVIHRTYVTLERMAAKRCHHLIAITPQMVEAFVKQRIAPQSMFTVVPSGVQVEKFSHDAQGRQRVRQRYGIAPDAPVVGIVARLDRLKGHADLLATLPRLQTKYPQVRMLFVGDGFDREALRDLPGVVRTERVPHDQVAAHLSAMDVHVLPSYQEGQSRTLIEALCCGCGIVAYDVGGMPAICVEGETGKLVPAGDRDALARAILWMLDHPEQRRTMTARGRERVTTRYSVQAMMAGLDRVYRELTT